MFKTLREQKEEVAGVESQWQGWKGGAEPDSALQQDQTQQDIIFISISKNSRSP